MVSQSLYSKQSPWGSLIGTLSTLHYIPITYYHLELLGFIKRVPEVYKGILMRLKITFHKLLLPQTRDEKCLEV